MSRDDDRQRWNWPAAIANVAFWLAVVAIVFLVVRYG